MKKDPGSIRSLGKITINVNIPLRNDLKAQATANNMTLVDYLRYLADQASETPIQTLLSGIKPDPAHLQNIPAQLNDLNMAVSRITEYLGLPKDVADRVNTYFPPQDIEAQFNDGMVLIENVIDSMKERLETAKQQLRLREAEA